MNKFLITLFLAFSLLTGGCSLLSIKDSETGKIDHAKVVRYMEPASYFACKAIIGYAINDDDKADKAKIIFDIAKAIRSLASGSVPTAEEVEKVIKIWSPDKIHWAQLAVELSMVYERFYDTVTETAQNALIFEALGELAEGCERAAKPYITVGSYQNHIDEVVKPFDTSRAVMKPIANMVMEPEKKSETASTNLGVR